MHILYTHVTVSKMLFLNTTLPNFKKTKRLMFFCALHRICFSSVCTSRSFPLKLTCICCLTPLKIGFNCLGSASLFSEEPVMLHAYRWNSERKNFMLACANTSYDKKEGKVKITRVHKIRFKFIEKISVCFWWVLAAPLWDQVPVAPWRVTSHLVGLWLGLGQRLGRCLPCNPA